MHTYYTPHAYSVSFAKEPYKRDYILQKRPKILRSLLIVATPYLFIHANWLALCIWMRIFCLTHVHCHTICTHITAIYLHITAICIGITAKYIHIIYITHIHITYIIHRMLMSCFIHVHRQTTCIHISAIYLHITNMHTYFTHCAVDTKHAFHKYSLWGGCD